MFVFEEQRQKLSALKICHVCISGTESKTAEN